MRIFVAGATGAIGRLLVPMLIREGHTVVAASRTSAGVERLLAQGARATLLDVFDRAAVEKAVAGAAPDVVVHQLTSLSGGSSVENARMRREGTRNLVDAARAAGVRRFIAQSIAWAYAPGDQPADEATPLDLSAGPPRDVSIGGVRVLETAAAEISEHVILRYGTFYGPGTWYAADGAMAAKLRAAELSANDAVTSFVHVDDAARAAVLALGWPPGIVNVVDDEPAPARIWVPAFAHVLGVSAPAVTAGRAAWERGATNALARARGWQPQYRSWRDGFAALSNP